MESHSAFLKLIQRYGLTEGDCNKEVSDIDLQRISSSYCKHWKKLPAYLGLESIVVEDLERSQEEEDTKRHKFLLRWKDRKGSAATYGKIINALLKIKSRQDAERVCAILKDSRSKVITSAASTTESDLPPSSIEGNELS